MTQQSFEGRTSSKSSEHGTPDEIFIPLNDEFHFEFDLAADPRNTKIPGRENFWTKEDDGLSRPWKRVPSFLNPPYSRSVWRWIQKAYEESLLGTTSVVLMNSNTESKWYHRIAVPHAHEIRHIEKRVGFIDWQAIWDGEKSIEDERNSSYHPSCILVFQSADSGISVPVRTVVSQRIDGVGFSYVSF